ncbi:GNAT family N-acetyltransferase [Gaetbulibacter sp. M235]|uniref:GNAT family N-acetyltransferase n=1 Tax=Gaetbulibacter sp. M235 TaxID=3126510 RepID=UPI00374F78AF
MPTYHCKRWGKIVGYALSMVEDFKDEIGVLKPMFDKIDDNLHSDISYIVMGQICVDKAFRKQGIFRGLYTFMKQQMQGKFDMIVTEVDKLNTRSTEAHFAVGFKALASYKSDNQDWIIIYLDLN